MRHFFKWLIGDIWVVSRTCWPHEDGYCIINRYRKTSMDHGMTREQADRMAIDMNKREVSSKPVASLLLLLVACLLLAGCIFTRPVYTESRRPILPLPEIKPLNEIPNELPAERKDAENAYNTATLNVVRLIEYAEALEAVIKQYNAESEKQNIKNGYTAVEEPPKP